MTMVDNGASANSRPLRDAEEVEAHIRAICFKTGPPALIGAELEWTLHHTAAPRAPLDRRTVARALGPHTPPALDADGDAPDDRRSAATPPPRTGGSAPASPLDSGTSHEPPDDGTPVALPGGGQLTAEPGGQLEISSAPARSLGELHTAVTTDLHYLRRLLAGSGLRLGDHGLDPHRAPRRLLDTPRYAAMERGFDARGPHGRTMMCSTAGLQVCLDAGRPDQLGLRWAAVCALGPLMVAAFANSSRQAGRDTGWASARMATWWGIDPRRSHPVDPAANDPAASWISYAMDAPLLCLRRPGGCWDPPPGITLSDWVNGALGHRPTADDIDYHLSTLFPPVRPRGYLEIRYLDAQRGDDWIAPVAVLAALLGDDATTQQALESAAPTRQSWIRAARHGLADSGLLRGATAVLDLACRRLEHTGLAPEIREQVIDIVHRRLRAAGRTGE